MTRPPVRAAICLSLSLLSGVPERNPAFAQDANPIVSLGGRWAGTAALVPASGPNELFRCVATYFPGEAGASLRQNLRCKSANYQFDGAAQLRITNGKVTGRWEDKINPLHGTISGNVTADGFLILLSGEIVRRENDRGRFAMPAIDHDHSGGRPSG